MGVGGRREGLQRFGRKVHHQCFEIISSAVKFVAIKVLRNFTLEEDKC